MQTESSTSRKAFRIAVIPGDGIGKEVTAEAVKVIEAVGRKFGRTFELEQLPWSADHYLQTGVTIPPNGYDTLRGFDAIFIGALGDPRVPDNRHARDILLGTRFELDLFVNYRPVKLLHERLCPLKGRGHRTSTSSCSARTPRASTSVSAGASRPAPIEEIAIQEEINTYRGVHRIIRYAFEYAKARGLSKVCMADKSNAMTHGHALWQRVFREVAAEYPSIEPTHYYIDALAMYMVLDPGQFQVIVTNNLFGDIITDLAATFQGGLGHGGVRKHSSGKNVDVRARARLGAEVCREEHREPDRRDFVGGADAGDARAGSGGRGDRRRGARSRQRGTGDARYRRDSRDARNGYVDSGAN